MTEQIAERAAQRAVGPAAGLAPEQAAGQVTEQAAGSSAGQAAEQTAGRPMERTLGFRVSSIEEVFPLADFLADALGEMAEIVAHDVRNLHTSVVYIRNGELSGRKVGDSTTDRALRLIQDRSYEHAEYVAGYAGKALARHEFRCATYFVKGYDGKLVGLLCVNVNITGLDDVIGVLTKLRSTTPGLGGAQEEATGTASVEENLSGDPEQTVLRITRQVLASCPVSTERLSRAEKLELVAQISREGVFLIRGAVNVVAPELGVSVPTLYRYLQEVKEN